MIAFDGEQGSDLSGILLDGQTSRDCSFKFGLREFLFLCRREIGLMQNAFTCF